MPKRLAPISLVITLLLLFTPASSQAAVYKDLGNHNLAQAIYRVGALDLMSGYAGNLFKPEQSISQLELLVVIMKTTGYTDKLPKSTKNAFWGQAYLDRAMQQQLINSNEAKAFKQEQPAARLDAVRFLYHALRLPIGEAKPGQDLITLSVSDQQAVNSVIAAGLMSRLADGTFHPEQKLTRAQTALLVSKLIDTNWAKLPSERRLTGWISKINSKGTNREIELTTLTGIKRYRLDPQAVCYIGSALYTPNHLLNTRVEILLSSKKQVTYLCYLEGFPSIKDLPSTIGTIKNLAIGSQSQLIISDLNCEEQVYPLSEFATVTDLKGQTPTSNLLALKPNTFVKIYLDKGKVLKTQILKTASVSGTIMRFDSYRMFLSAQGSGKNRPEWFNYYDRARVVDSKGIRVASPIRGDKVKVTYLDPDPQGIDEEIPLEIAITSRPVNRKVTGVVQSLSINNTNPQIVLSKNKSYLIDSSLISSFPAIPVSAKVEFMIDGANVVMQVVKFTLPTPTTTPDSLVIP